MIVYKSGHRQFSSQKLSTQYQKCTAAALLYSPDCQALFWLFKTNDKSSNPTNEPDV